MITYNERLRAVVLFSIYNGRRPKTCSRTSGVNAEIPLELQLFLWSCIDQLPPERDYPQVFQLEPMGQMQSITHSSEQPPHRMTYVIPSDKPITAKLYAIDDGEHSTMLFASEY